MSVSALKSEIDIAAPGVDILSTVPTATGGIATISIGSTTIEGSFMKGSPIPDSPDGLSGSLVVCPDLGMVPCESYGKHVCLLER